MFTKVNRTLRKALLGAILAGATIFSAPTTGCDPAGAKDVSANAALAIERPVLQAQCSIICVPP
jgi:hypothetical protein